MTEAVTTIITDPNAGKADPAAAAAAASAGANADPNAGAGGADPNAGKADPNAGKAAELGPDGKPKVAAAAVVADWRKDLAGDDEKALKALERVPSQKDLLKSWLEQRALIASGKHKEPLAADATEEQKAEYRKANGIPATAEDYYKSLPEGVVFGEADKPGVTKFLQDMHALNAPPAMVSKALEVFVAAQEEGAMLRSEQDVTVRDATSEALRTEWGPDYKPNINAMSSFIKGNIPEADQANFLNARMGDGTPVFSHPGMVKAFAQLGRVLNPTGTTTPGGGIDKLDAIEDAIKGYEKRMATDRPAWFKDAKAQDHYRQLVDARDKMTKKA